MYIPAGAWCYWLEPKHEGERANGAHCSKRADERKGSTRDDLNKPEMSISKWGMGSENSDFNRWEFYEFIYCDGFSWQGRREEPLTTRDGRKIYFRGHFSFLDLIENIFQERQIVRSKLV